MALMPKMFFFSALMTCSVVLPGSGADPRAVPRRFKPVVQLTEEIDVNDITFTTSAPLAELPSSHGRHGGSKPEGGAKGGHGRLGLYGNVVPLEKVYATGHPVVVPVTKYKPYKVFKVQDGYRPVSYKPKLHDRGKSPTFEPSTTHAGPDATKQRVVPFSGQPARAAAYSAQDNKNFVPSPTFSPTVLALINTEADVAQSPVDWTRPTRPQHVRSGKKTADGHRFGVHGEEFPATEKPQENLAPHNAYKETPQQSESFVSEISAVHKGGSGGDGLDGVAESLDLKTGERVEFQMYGMDGPQSYKFGFDTGKGQNRHFRFEERDNTGKVKGHYGYLDEDGKMRIMKYEADPVTGFHAGPVEISPDDN